MTDVPVDEVRRMRDQGMSDEKIVESLQSDGYKSSQIFDAMTQSDMSPAREATDVTEDFPDVMGSVQGESGSPQTSTDESTEELVESIIDERWQEIEQDIKSVVEWKQDTEQRIDELSNSLESLERRFEKLHGAIVGKVGEYDQHLSDVASEIEAMQKAFSKMLPKFSESVNELASIVDDLNE